MEITIDLIQDTIWQLRKDSAQYADKQRKFLKFDGAYCKDEVRSHLKALEIIRNQTLADTLCICPAEVSAIFYGAKAYLGHLCADPEPDYTKTDRPDKVRWVLEHPECVLYDYWVDFLKAQCQRIGLDLAVKVKECKSLDLDVRVAYDQACKEVLLDIQVEEIKCDFGVDITVEELKSCKADYDFYVKPLNCDVSLSTFVRAVDCGVSVNAIVRAIQCGADIQLTAQGVEFCYPDEMGDLTIIPLTYDLAVDDATVCYYTDVVVSVENFSHPSAHYAWDFGAGSVPGTAVGIGPHTVYYESAGTKTIQVIATAGDQVTVKTIVVTVSSCPGQIIGTLLTDLGATVGGATIRLYEDFNEDGIADGAFIRNISPNGSGNWAMASIPPGHYIISCPGNLTVISVTDDGTAGADPIDTFVILSNNPTAGVEAFKIQVRPGLIQGKINIVVTTP